MTKEMRDLLVDRLDKVISPLTKATWQAFIDRLKKEDD